MLGMLIPERLTQNKHHPEKVVFVFVQILNYFEQAYNRSQNYKFVVYFGANKTI